MTIRRGYSTASRKFKDPALKVKSNAIERHRNLAIGPANTNRVKLKTAMLIEPKDRRLLLPNLFSIESLNVKFLVPDNYGL